MIDDKKIEEAARYYCNNRYFTSQDAPFIADWFIHGANWAINELLNDLWHDACEVPWNDKGKVLSFSREIGYRKLYDMNAMLDKTTCNTYKEMWEKEVKAYRWSDWIYVDELFGLITRGGNQ